MDYSKIYSAFQVSQYLFTTCQCICPGLLVNLISLPTGKAISGLVHVMVYIKLPITLEYSSCDKVLSVLITNGACES